MVALQKDTQDIHYGVPKEFLNYLSLLKMDSYGKEINERVAAIEKRSELYDNLIMQTLFSVDEEPRKSKVKRENNPVMTDTIQDCKKIIDRTLEILSDWSETQDIKLQIQYAAVINGKIDNIKKTDYIQSNHTRKKICTLLKNVIRINVTDSVFSKEQISLLKDGFSALLSEQIQQKDMLQLNRDFLKQKLLTMPAWE